MLYLVTWIIFGVHQIKRLQTRASLRKMKSLLYC